MHVLVVDDSTLVRQSLSSVAVGLEGVSSVDTVGTAAAGLVAHLARSADLALVAMSLPDGDGLALVRALRSSGMTGTIVVTANHPSDADRHASQAAGADGFFDKASGADRLVRDLQVLTAK